MYSKRKVLDQIMGNQETYNMLLNALAVGEIGSIDILKKLADLLPDPSLREKILRLYNDELKHGALCSRRLEECGLQPTPLPQHLDYDTFLHELEFGMDDSRLETETPLSEDEVVQFLANCQIREERSIVELEGMMECFSRDEKTVALLSEIVKDEYRHAAYAMVALEEYARKGRGGEIRRLMRSYRRKEAIAHAKVSINFIREFSRHLHYPAWFLISASAAIWLHALAYLAFPLPLVSRVSIRENAPDEFRS